MMEWYREDLAYIHDVGHADFALDSAPGILEILAQNGIRNGLVIDLGCGSGLWARDLTDAGYRVLGIDISEAMIEISHRRVPEAEFQGGSLFDADIPRAVRALVPSGVFVFDVLGPGQVPPGAAARGFRVGEDWAVLSEREEDTERGLWRAASSASGRWGTTTGGTTRSTACGCTIHRSCPPSSAGWALRYGRCILTAATR